jgi:hypothetical protein
MSEKTLKLEGWAPQAKPSEDNDMLYHRQLIVEIIYGLWFRKKEILAKMGMPPQPISLLEIYREYQSRVAMLQSIKEWKWAVHSKRWLDRRVNECACCKYYLDGVPKIVAATAGKYEPNPQIVKA